MNKESAVLMVNVCKYIDNSLYLLAYILTFIDISEDVYLKRLVFTYARRSSTPDPELTLHYSYLTPTKITAAGLPVCGFNGSRISTKVNPLVR